MSTAFEQRDRNADECAVQSRTICTTGGQKAKAKGGDGSGYWTEPHSDAFRERLARLRVDASRLVDKYDRDEQQDGSELAGDRRQRDTADPNSIYSGHRADPVKRCARRYRVDGARGGQVQEIPRRFTPRDDANYLNPTAYGFLEARVDFDRSRSTC